MIKVAHYRRGGRKATKQRARFFGIKERMHWILSKEGAMSGTELAKRLGLELPELNYSINYTYFEDETSQIRVDGWYKTPEGFKDGVYYLVGKPKRVAAKPQRKQGMVISHRQKISDDDRQKNTERAARRARLIAAGLYIDEFEAVL